MYESTVDVLYHLYDKLSIGGYVIMDDVSAKCKSEYSESHRSTANIPFLLTFEQVVWLSFQDGVRGLLQSAWDST